MGSRDTYHKTLVRACIVAGDEVELAKQLDVPVDVLVTWLLGDKPVPPQIFLRAVDVVLAAQKQHIRAVERRIKATRRFLDRLKQRYR
jgi:hypothetical protein